MSYRNVPVGHFVQWFRQGDVNTKPTACLVVETDGKGTLKLTQFPGCGGMGGTVRNVRHKDDPWLRDKPNVRRESGCWDYLEPIFVGLLEEQTPPPKELRTAEKERILKMHAEGKTPAQIARTLIGCQGWTAYWIEQFINQQKKELVEA